MTCERLVIYILYTIHLLVVGMYVALSVFDRLTSQRNLSHHAMASKRPAESPAAHQEPPKRVAGGESIEKVAGNSDSAPKSAPRVSGPVLRAEEELPSAAASSSGTVGPDVATHISRDATAKVKRDDYITWDDYFMAVAFLSAMRSKDPSTQVGAAIVNPQRRIVGIGYNGFPAGCSDDALPWGRTGDGELDTKYPYVVHAETNAILNARGSVAGCTLYVALFPCNECAKLIIQAGIKEVVYLSDKYAGTTSMTASRTMLDMAGVTQRQHKPAKPKLLVDFGGYV